MKTLVAATALLVMSGAVAHATDDKAKSSGDAPAASGQQTDKPGGENQQTDKPGGEKMSPGTTGAMEKSNSGAATTPEEVQKQGGAATAPTTTGNPQDKSAPAGDKK